MKISRESRLFRFALIPLAIVAAGCSAGSNNVGNSGVSTSQSTTTTQATSTSQSTSTTQTSTTTAPSGALPTGGPVPAGFHPVSVTFVSPTVGYVLGTAGKCCTAVMLRTTDGGTHWQSVPPPPVTVRPGPGQSGGASSVRFASPLDGWVFGPKLYATHDGGKTWQDLSVHGSVLALETSDRVVVAVVSPCQTGTSCIEQASSSGGSFAVFHTEQHLAGPGAISLNGSGGFAFLGFSGSAKPVAHIFASSNLTNQQGWNPFSDPCAVTPLTLGSFVAPDPVHLYSLCVGNDASGVGEKIVTVTQNGATRVAGKAPPPGLPEELSATPTGVLAVAAEYAQAAKSFIYRSLDGGRSWGTSSFPDALGVGFSELGFTTTTQGVVIHGSPTSASRGGPDDFLMTHDAGATWLHISFTVPASNVCLPQQLSVGTHTTSASGHFSLTFIFKNIGTSACVLLGYPAVAALNSAGQQAAIAKQTLNGHMGGVAGGSASIVVLAPGASGSAVAESTALSPTPCPVYPSLVMTPPDAGQPKTFSFQNAGTCNLEVHPVVPGTSGVG